MIFRWRLNHRIFGPNIFLGGMMDDIKSSRCATIATERTNEQIRVSTLKCPLKLFSQISQWTHATTFQKTRFTPISHFNRSNCAVPALDRDCHFRSLRAWIRRDLIKWKLMECFQPLAAWEIAAPLPHRYPTNVENRTFSGQNVPLCPRTGGWPATLNRKERPFLARRLEWSQRKKQTGRGGLGADHFVTAASSRPV